MIYEAKVNVIVARGTTADLLAKKLTVPVIKVNVSNFRDSSNMSCAF